ncbi:hypothetical protein B0H14DRAFT_2473968, partial [Mycena olivaceomarginata]
MVSFQCHACQDTVKKPKLDQHYNRCYAGFDCIDCSATFNSPAEYKSHTQCISEAEKYEKSVYKGPKTAPTGKSTYPPPPPAPPSTVRNWVSGGRGRGGFGRGGGWGAPRTGATG